MPNIRVPECSIRSNLHYVKHGGGSISNKALKRLRDVLAEAFDCSIHDLASPHAHGLVGAVSDLRRNLEAMTAKWKDERSASKELKRLVQKSEKSRSKLRGEFRDAQATWKVVELPYLTFQ